MLVPGVLTLLACRGVAIVHGGPGPAAAPLDTSPPASISYSTDALQLKGAVQQLIRQQEERPAQVASEVASEKERKLTDQAAMNAAIAEQSLLAQQIEQVSNEIEPLIGELAVTKARLDADSASQAMRLREAEAQLRRVETQVEQVKHAGDMIETSMLQDVLREVGNATDQKRPPEHGSDRPREESGGPAPGTLAPGPGREEGAASDIRVLKRLIYEKQVLLAEKAQKRERLKGFIAERDKALADVGKQFEHLKHDSAELQRVDLKSEGTGLQIEDAARLLGHLKADLVAENKRIAEQAAASEAEWQRRIHGSKLRLRELTNSTGRMTHEHAAFLEAMNTTAATKGRLLQERDRAVADLVGETTKLEVEQQRLIDETASLRSKLSGARSSLGDKEREKARLRSEMGALHARLDWDTAELGRHMRVWALQLPQLNAAKELAQAGGEDGGRAPRAGAQERQGSAAGLVTDLQQGAQIIPILRSQTEELESKLGGLARKFTAASNELRALNARGELPHQQTAGVRRGMEDSEHEHLDMMKAQGERQGT